MLEHCEEKKSQIYMMQYNLEEVSTFVRYKHEINLTKEAVLP